MKIVLEDLNPLLAGAIGENLVVTELEKLPDQFTLIKDYFKEFDKRIK